MPLLFPSDYRPPAHLWNGHLQTIIPALFRKVSVSYTRERIETPDDDFLDLDWSYGNPSGSGHLHLSGFENLTGVGVQTLKDVRTLVILSHGLEGDSGRQYLAGMVRHLTANGFDCLAWNYRSCSGEMNRQARFYHLGETGDLQLVIDYALQKGYKHINLLGFSAGGNVTLKYLGEQGKAIHPAIEKAVVFSVPLHLTSASRRLEAWDSQIYNQRFNRTLKRKVFEKAALMPGVIHTEGLQKVRTLREFDNLFTSRLHGFRDAEDYYEQSSALHYLDKIAIPTLIVNAKNDPFLSRECFPEELARQLPNVWMEFPTQGGHCGFTPAGPNRTVYWSEERALRFLRNTN
ncbi:alpha/beta fold hydrolase [Larkinella knui]|uniref:Alpha/beta fold hydrolase n=1 Tax=Larkinella knui TaxID=2025310 RepID=A0A3P1CN17_9BACT|nr:alpha/beta fold hydrolase [Larkinella knui]RRB14717.1 alpha/beta fold hydrolase [Larkinella knui]